MKRLIGLAGAVTTLVLLVGAPSAFAATTLHVNAATGIDTATCGSQASPCKTIHQAVLHAFTGYTIVVAPGTYDEGTVTIDKSLTLEGAQAGNPGSASRASESPSTESVLSGGNIDIEASDVTVDGFAFSYAGNQVCVACVPGVNSGLDITDSGVTIENNVFSGYQANNFGPWQADDAIGVNHVTNTVITHNYFTSPDVRLGDFGGAVVQWFDGGCSGANVSSNVFDNADANALADMYFYCDDEPLSVLTVSGNQDTIGGSSSLLNVQHVGGSGGEVDVTDNTATMTPASGSSGLYFSTGESGVQTLNVTGNTLTGDPFRAVKLSTNAQLPGTVNISGNDFSHSGVGIYVGGNALQSSANVTISGNDLSDESGDNVPDVGAGVYIPANASTPAAFTISGNDLSGDWAGLYVGSGGLNASATVTMRANDLTGEVGGTFTGTNPATVIPPDGVYNNPSSGGSVDATDNWWGCNAGPGQSGCSDVTSDCVTAPPSGCVTYDPRLVLGVSPSLGSLLTGARTSVTADLTHDSNGANTSGSGTVPDGTSVAFSTDLGSLSAPSAGTSLGMASVNLHSSTAGTAHVTATLDGQSVSTTVTFSTGGPDASQSTLTPLNSSVVADGSSTVALTVQAMNAFGAPVTTGGDTVAITKLSGVGTVGSVTDNGDGTYTATVTAPSSAGTGVFVATLDGNPVESGSSAQTQATVHFVAPPSITSVDPGSGAIGSTVTLTGTNLTNVTHVKVNGTNAAFRIVSATQITFTVPAGATTGPITVTYAGSSASSPSPFTVAGQPSIASFSPGSGAVGDLVTISGTNLANTVGVQIGRIITVPVSVSDTQVTFRIPPGAVTGSISILSRDGSATAPGTLTVT